VEILFQQTSSHGSYYAGWLISTAFISSWHELAESLTDEQVEIIKDALDNPGHIDDDELEITAALGIAAIAAGAPDRFGRKEILNFCSARQGDDSRWNPIIAEVSGRRSEHGRSVRARSTGYTERFSS
jgi:hypothetical protein